jgi:hypothetical protein
MIHIVFNTADVAVLQQALDMEASMVGDIVEIKDEYAVGPLADLHTEAGIAARRDWWRMVLAGGDYDGLVDQDIVNDTKTVAGLTDRMTADQEEIIWIWAAQNKHDVSGYYWLMSQLAAFQGRVFILYLNNLPFINEKGNIFYPQWLHQIQPREFLKARKLARPITLSEFEIDPEEWQRRCNEPSGIRLLEGGKKLIRKGEDFYDDLLIGFMTGEWQKGSRVITQFLNKGKETTGDAYLLWRLKSMATSGRIEWQGTLGVMKEFEVRMQAQASSSTEAKP